MSMFALLTLGQKSQKFIRPLLKVSFFLGRESLNVAFWVFQVAGGWIWSRHPICTSGRGAFQIFLMTQFLTARISFWLLGGAKSPEVSASHLPLWAELGIAQIVFRLRKPESLFSRTEWTDFVGVTWPREAEAGGSSSGNWDNSGE